MKFVLLFIRIKYWILSVVSPKLAASKAFDLFQIVRKKSIRDRELDFFKLATAVKIDFEPEEILVYELGDPLSSPIVLVHGWDSNPGSLSNIVFALVKQGRRVLVLNIPGHAHAELDRTNLYVAKKAVIAFFNYYKLDNVSCITHSFGSAMLSYGLSEVDARVDKMIFLTSPNNVIEIFDEFKEMINLGSKAYEIMCRMADEVLGEGIEGLIVAEKLDSVHYNSLLIIHDKNDKVIPYKNALEIQKRHPETRIAAFENIGHYRMLWNDKVLQEVLEFIELPEVVAV